MPTLLTPDEFSREFGGPGRETPEPEAGWGTRFGAAVDRFQAGLYGVGEAVTGSETLGALRRENQAAGAVNRARAVRDTGAPDSFRDVGGVGDAARWVGGLLVDSSPELAVTLGTAGAGALAGVGAMGRLAMAAGASAPSGMGGILQNQREEAGTTDLLSAAALTVPYVAVDMLGLDAALASGRLTRSGIRALDRMQGVKGVAARSGATFVRAAPVEGASETGQELINQAGRIAVNPDQSFFNPEANERYVESFAGGAAMGGTVSTALGGWQRSQPLQQAPSAPPQPAPAMPQGFRLQSEPTRDATERVLGLGTPATRQGYEAQFEEAANAPSGVRVADPETGIERELTAYELQQMQLGAGPTAAPLGDTTQTNAATAPNTQGAGAIQSALQAQAEAIQAAQAAQQPPTPEQQRLQAVREKASQVAAEAQAQEQRARTEFGITKPAALATYGDLEAAHTEGLISDEQFATAAGMLAGTATGLGKVRKELSVLSKEQESLRLQAEQTERVAKADADQKAADIAKLQRNTAATQGAPANVPTPAQPGTQASPAPGAQAAPQGEAGSVAAPTKTPGQRLVETLEARAGKKMTEPVRRRLYLLAGLDPDEGFMVGSPKTLAEVAAIEAALTGKSKGVSREAVRKSLVPFGIDGGVIDRLGAMAATQEDTSSSQETEDGAEYTPDRAAPEDNTPPMAEETAFGAATDDGRGQGDSGMRVRSNLGSVGIEDMTPAQRRAQAQADKMLAQAAGASTKRGAEAIERARSTIKEATTPVVSAEQVARNAEIMAENERLLAEMNAEVDKRSQLRRELNHPTLVDEVPRAKEEWTSFAVPEDGDLSWDDLTARQQAEWVRAFARWDNGVDDDRTYFRKFTEINDGAKQADAGTTARAGERTGGVQQPAMGERAEAGQDAAGRAAGTPGAVQPTGVPSGAAGQEGPGGERNAAAINREVLDAATVPLNQEVVESARFNRGGQTLPGQLDKSGQVVGVVSKTLADMERTPSVKDVLDNYRKRGLEHVLATVQDWYTTSSKGDWSGAYTTVDGRTAMVLPIRTLLFPSMVEQTIHHELGHAVDLIEAGGLFSGLPEFNLRIVGDKVRAHGDVASELVQHFETDPASPMGSLLKYPLDRTKYGDLNAQAIREELFAQVWSVWNTPTGRDFIADNLPDTAYFMEKVDEEIRQDEYRAKVVALSANGGAPQAADGTVRFDEGQAVLPTTAARGAGGGQPVLPGGRGGQVAVRFNRSQAVPAPAAKAESVARNFWGKLTTGAKDAASWTLLRASFTKDLAERAAALLPSAREYIKLVETNGVEKTRAERNIEAILDRFNTLPVHERGTGPASVNAFIQASTTQRKWAYKPDFLDDVQVDPALEARFNGLSAAGQKLVEDVFRHGHDNLQALKAAVNDNVASEFDALISELTKAGDLQGAAKAAKDKQKSLRDFASLQDLQGDWPYAPLRRFGNHVVVGMSQAYLDAEQNEDTALMDKLKRDPKHYYVAFRETKGEARKTRDEIAGQYAYADNFAKDTAHEKLYGGRDVLGAFRRLRDLASQTQDEALGPKASKALNRLMVDLQLTLLAEQSARQAERQRMNVAGADADMMRAFATQGRASAHFISALKSNGAVNEQLQAMRREADARTTGREERREFYNELLARHVMGMDYAPSPLTDKALGASSVWMLLTSPAYFLTNATQPFAMTLPVLAGRHGYAKSAEALRRAYVDLMPLIKDGTITQDDYSALPADVRAVVQELADKGFIDISLEQDLGRWRSDEKAAGSRVLGTVVSKLRGVTQTVEAVNRLATAIAAARLERETGSGNEVKYAGKVIYDTHGDYTGFNAPRVMRAPVGRLVTQFRKFQLIQLSMYAKLLNQAFKGATADERAVGRAALAYSLTHMFMLGGLLGMPGAQAVGFVLRHAFGDDDEPNNPELTLRRIIGDDTLADLLTKGVPKLAGLDISGRVGAGGMLSLLPYADVGADREGYEAAVVAALGPFLGGLLPRAADGVGLIRQGEYWMGLEQMMPKGFSDMSKAVRFNVEGVTSRRGDMLMAPEDVSELATLGQLIGLPTTSLTDRQFRSSTVYTSDKHFQERATKVKRAYAEAVQENDTGGMAEARASWQALQSTRREYGYKVQPLSELLKAPQEQARRNRQVVEGVVYNRNNRGLADQLGS